MAWPTDDLTSTHLDAGTDDPSQARAELYNLLVKVQAILAENPILDAGAQSVAGVKTLTDNPAIDNATANRSALLIKNSGASAGLFGLSGIVEGDASSDIAIFAETGKGHRFYVNGSATEAMVLSSAAVLTVGGNQVWDAGNQKIIFKTADESVTSSTTLQDDDHLVGFALTTGKWYRVKAYLYVTASAAGAFKYQVVYTNAPADGTYTAEYFTGAGAVAHSVGSSPLTAVKSAAGIENDALKLDMVVKANATTGGTFKLQWAQDASDAGATILYAGSYIELTQLD